MVLSGCRTVDICVKTNLNKYKHLLNTNIVSTITALLCSDFPLHPHISCGSVSPASNKRTRSHCSKLEKKKKAKKQISQKVENCQEMIQCRCNSKIIPQHTSRNQRGRQISGDVSFMMMRVYMADAEWTTPQSREYIPTLSYWCPIFSLPFGSCQRSTSKQRAVESRVTVDVTLMHCEAWEVTSL